MTKKYKTSQKNRESYIYYSGGKKIATITPGENDVTEVDIEYLHSEDDREVDEKRRYDYRIAFNFESFVNEDGESTCDNNKYVEDIINSQLIQQDENFKRRVAIENLYQAMDRLQPQQQKLIEEKYFNNKTNVEIAKSEGVTEAAIRNRLSKIYRRLEKLLKKGS